MAAGSQTAQKAPRRQSQKGQAQKGQAQKGLQRRAEIIETARQRLISKGMEGLVLRDISSELGITHGNLQYYFPTKNELIKAIYDEEVERYTSAMQDSLEGAPDSVDVISEIVDANLKILARPETRLWRVLFGMAEHVPELAELLEQENRHFDSVLTQQLRDLAPHLGEDRVRGVSRILRLIVDGVGIEFIYTDPTGPRARALADDIKRAVRQLMSID